MNSLDDMNSLDAQIRSEIAAKCEQQNKLNSRQSGQAIQAAPPKQETAFSAINDFDPALSRLESLIANIGECADKLVGSRPSDIDKSIPTPAPQHLIYAIHARRNRLVAALDRFEIEARRLSGGLMEER